MLSGRQAEVRTVNIHNQVQALRENFAILNYLAVLKIVKKHDKRFVDTAIARTMVPTMLSMSFLRMSGRIRGAKPVRGKNTRTVHAFFPAALLCVCCACVDQIPSP